jgi:hypothetical protein
MLMINLRSIAFASIIFGNETGPVIIESCGKKSYRKVCNGRYLHHYQTLL